MKTFVDLTPQCEIHLANVRAMLGTSNNMSAIRKSIAICDAILSAVKAGKKVSVGGKSIVIPELGM